VIAAAIGLGVTLRLAWWSGTFALNLFGLLETAGPGQGVEFTYYFACPSLNVFILTILVTAILTPITEEIINRGFIIGTMSNRDPRIAILVTSLLFAVLHRTSGMPDAFVFGLFAGVQLLRYQTLWAPIIAHGTYNLVIALDWGCLHVTWIPEGPTAATIQIGAAMTIASLLFFAVSFWLVAYVRPGAD